MSSRVKIETNYGYFLFPQKLQFFPMNPNDYWVFLGGKVVHKSGDNGGVTCTITSESMKDAYSLPFARPFNCGPNPMDLIRKDVIKFGRQELVKIFCENQEKEPEFLCEYYRLFFNWGADELFRNLSMIPRCLLAKVDSYPEYCSVKHDVLQFRESSHHVSKKEIESGDVVIYMDRNTGRYGIEAPSDRTFNKWMYLYQGHKDGHDEYVFIGHEDSEHWITDHFTDLHDDYIEVFYEGGVSSEVAFNFKEFPLLCSKILIDGPKGQREFHGSGVFEVQGHTRIVTSNVPDKSFINQYFDLSETNGNSEVITDRAQFLAQDWVEREACSSNAFTYLEQVIGNDLPACLNGITVNFHRDECGKLKLTVSQ